MFLVQLTSNQTKVFGSTNSQIFKKYQDEIKTINSSLQKYNNITAKFSQSNSDSTASGTIYINRERRMLAIDYETGDLNITLFSLNGRNLYLDKDTNEKIEIPTDIMIINALLAQRIDDDQFLFEDIARKGNNIELIFRLSSNPSEGLIHLVFNIEKEEFIYFQLKESNEYLNKVKLFNYKKGNNIINQNFFDNQLNSKNKR